MLTKKEQKFNKEVNFLNKMKQFPALFDSKERLKYPVSKGTEMWVSFANLFEEHNAESAKKEWRNIRDQYHKFQDPRAFRHFEAMQYFDNYSSLNNEPIQEREENGNDFHCDQNLETLDNFNDNGLQNDESNIGDETVNHQAPQKRGAKRKLNKGTSGNSKISKCGYCGEIF
ncbi:uncharacterized protein LOC122510963 isoform X2 [Leptopilina heterotoma]|nr:uncharacterized protein LOC122510963 isoform X2 [Leptopilina heterotoma]